MPTETQPLPHDVTGDCLLCVRNLSVYFRRRGAFGRSGERLAAVEDASLEIGRGEAFGLVGESGSGKSTLSRAILRLIPIDAGEIWFDGQPLADRQPRALRPLRRHMQVVFQNPTASLNPRLRVETIVGEALRVHGLGRSAGERRERVAVALREVGLGPDALRRYPHEFSGGQKQRIGIARALALEPRFVVLDEPVSALDVSVRAQILNLLADLQRRRNLTYLFVTHDLELVRYFCERTAVLQRGRIVEMRPTSELFESPRHEYTRQLLAARVPLSLP